MPKGAVVLGVTAISLGGLLLWRVTRSNAASIRGSGDSEIVKKQRTFGEAMGVIMKGKNIAERCVVLEDNILPLTFHDAGSNCIYDNEELMIRLLDVFTAYIEKTSTNSQPHEETEARLCGWIISNVSFISKARPTFLHLENSHNKSVVCSISQYLTQLVRSTPTEIIEAYNADSKVQSVFLSTLQILVNVSGHDPNIVGLCTSNIMSGLADLVEEVRNEANNEKLIIHIIRIFVNYSIAVRDMDSEVSNITNNVSSCVYDICEQLASSESEEISERAILITTNLNKLSAA